VNAQIISVALASAVIASLVTGGFSLWAQKRLLEHQAAEGDKKDRRSLRDARLARLREDYRIALQAVALFLERGRAAELLRPAAEQFRTEQMAELQKEWAKLYADFNRAAYAIALETDSQDVLAPVERASDLFAGYQEPRYSLQPKNSEQQRADTEEFERLVNRIETAARAHLGRIERSV
jgi:hypothetical protein